MSIGVVGRRLLALSLFLFRQGLRIPIRFQSVGGFSHTAILTHDVPIIAA